MKAWVSGELVKGSGQLVSELISYQLSQSSLTKESILSSIANYRILYLVEMKWYSF